MFTFDSLDLQRHEIGVSGTFREPVREEFSG